MINFAMAVTEEMRSADRVAGVKQQIADTRYSHEVSGIEVAGVFFNTERDSQALLTGAALQSVIDPTYVCRWKTPSGFIELSAEQLLTISQVMRKHVQDCFNREAELVAAVEDGSYTESMLTEGWP